MENNYVSSLKNNKNFLKYKKILIKMYSSNKSLKFIIKCNLNILTKYANKIYSVLIY
jgi:hypothetical protein